MYRLQKIKELRGFRFFQDFIWDESNCKLFERNNLIYGWNGSGKTTLCDFLKELELGNFTENGTKTSLLFFDTDTNIPATITHNGLGTIPYSIKVFHNNYIEENIIKVDNVKHIFAVGREQNEKIEEIKQLKNLKKDEEVKLRTLEAELNSINDYFEQLKSKDAAIVKNAANYTNAYNKIKFYCAYQNLKESLILSEKDYQSALTAIRAEKKLIIPLFNVDLIQSSVSEYVHSILVETPVNKTIEILKENTQISVWVEDGLKVHEDKKLTICQFCGNIIPSDRLELLKGHFNKSYKELSDKIDNSVKQLKFCLQQFENITAGLPDSGLLYLELRDKYISLLNEAQNLSKKYVLSISQIIQILSSKKCDMISDKYIGEFESVISELSFDYSVYEKILDIINQHNKKTSDFEISIKESQKKIEYHLISQFSQEISASETAVLSKNKEVTNQSKILSNLVSRIEILEKEVINTQIPAESINNDITFIMGRNELIFKNTALGYQIMRKDKRARNLSRGEQNAIALIYFFNTFTDVNVNIQNSIVVLDDPISSFDSNFYYNAISYIREKTINAGQVFIFTHKFSLFKDYALMYKGNTNRYMIRRENDNPTLQNEDNLISEYHDEYAYLFKQVYEFVKHPPENTSEFLCYPNIARRLLEGYITFKMPVSNANTSLLDRVMALQNGCEDNTACRAILRLLNNNSHLQIIKDGEMSDDVSNIAILPDILNNLLKFMKQHDQKHFEILAHQCDHDYDNVKEEMFDIQPIRMVKLFNMPLSLGVDMLLTNDENNEEIETDNKDCSFAVKVSGNSMEPKIFDKNIVLIKETEHIPKGCICIVLYNGELLCKKVITNQDKILLVSLNKMYKPIEIQSNDDFKIFGEVIKVIS